MAKNIEMAAEMIERLTNEHERLTGEIERLGARIRAIGPGSDAARTAYQDRARVVEHRRDIESRLNGMLWIWDMMDMDLTALDSETILRLVRLDHILPAHVSKVLWEAVAVADATA